MLKPEQHTLPEWLFFFDLKKGIPKKNSKNQKTDTGYLNEYKINILDVESYIGQTLQT